MRVSALLPALPPRRYVLPGHDYQMRKSELLIVIPLIPIVPFYIAYALAKQAINPEIDTLKLIVSIRLLSTRTRLYRARLSGLADTQQLEKWHASTTK